MRSMPKWLIRTFTTDAGGKPVDDWIRSLDASARAEVALTIDLLKEHCVALGLPFARYIDDGIWELRARDEAGIYRVVYFHWKGRTFGLLHAFTKATRAMPAKELALARSRRNTWIGRTKGKGFRDHG
jgi:phage-related protein